MNEVAKIENTNIGPSDVPLRATSAVTPMEMINTAIERGADVDQLTKLMDLQERWEKTEARKLFVAAMSEFQQACPTIDKTLKAHNSTYAGLAETLEQIRELMSKCGLSHSWKTEQAEGQISVTCCVTHTAGHQECTTMSAGADTSGSKNNIQAIGSTVKYLQRYTLFSILGLASKEHDDDGKAAGLGASITEEQEATLSAKMRETETDKARFLKAYNIETLADLPASKFNDAMSKLARKAAK